MFPAQSSLAGLRALIAASRFPAVITQGGALLAVNDAWVAMTGFRREQAEGRPYVEFMPPEERARQLERARLRAERPGSLPFSAVQTLTLKANGHAAMVYVQPTPVAALEGGEPYVVSNAFVLPERDAEIELAELLVATSSALLSTRTIDEVRAATTGQLIGAGYHAAFFTADGAAIYPAGAALPADARPEDLREARVAQRPVFLGARDSLPSAVLVPLPREGGAELFALAGPHLVAPLRASLRLFAQGVVSALANASVIADLERRNLELSETRAEMLQRERLAALGELAASIAHEVRNPVGIVANAASLLRRRTAAVAEAGALLAIIDEECVRLGRMVQDLLDFARPRPLTVCPEPLAEIVADAVSEATLHADCVARRVRFELEIAPDLPPVVANRQLLRQALVNLLINAAQASAPDGVVTARAAREGEGGLSLAVIDHGAGVPPELAERIFEPFFTTRAQGTGLGLAVVRRAIDELRGTIAVRATTGGGTTMAITLGA